MTPAPSMQQKRECMWEYDAFLKKAFINDMRDFYKACKRRRKKQVLFSELEDWLVEALQDESAENEMRYLLNTFKVMGLTVTICSDRIYEALFKLNKQQRDVILMYFWLGMNDREIAEQIGKKTRKVNYIREASYEKLAKVLEGQKR